MGKKDDLYISVPSLFKCPISLDVMKSPVSLCTGVTYDRASIQRWLDYGHNTCPATMQVLDTKDFVPNHTLHRLIQIWSNNNHSSSSSSSSTNNSPQFHSLSFVQTGELINQVLEMREKKSVLSSQALFESFVKILCFATESDENRRFLASNELFLDCLMSMVCAREGPVCSDQNNPDLLEAVLKVLHLIATSRCCNSVRQKMGGSCEVVTSLVRTLKTGFPGSRVAAAGIIGAIAQDLGSKKPVFENQELVPELVELLKQGRQTQEVGEIQALLSCLISVSSTRRNKLKLIRVGGVKMVVDLMSSYQNSNSSNDNDNNNNMTIELLLTLLEMLVGGIEGRVAISGDPNCVPLIIHKLMKVSKTANEHGIALLWSLCYLFRDQKAKEAVMRSNGGLTKILLLMQSDCSPTVKRMCCDLLRIFKVNSKSCLASYDTKTTHIMPC